VSGRRPPGHGIFRGVHLAAAIVLSVVLRVEPDASPPARQSPEAELEAQLQASVTKLPPAEVVVLLESPDPKRYRLEEAVIRLDGVPVAVNAVLKPGEPPRSVSVSEGDHVLSARLVYRGPALGPYPWEEGPRWTLPARVSLQASRGLRLHVRLTVEANERAPVVTQRLALQTAVEPEMLVAIDDAPLPPPPKLPEPVAAPTPLSAPPPPTAVVAPPSPAKKKPTKRVARARTAPPSVAAPPAAAVVPTASTAATAEGLEQATARLRAALSAPRDGGSASDEARQ
jgi:hypothetical protein